MRDGPPAEGPVPEGSAAEGPAAAGSVSEGSVSEAATAPDEEPLPTLQQEFAELTPDLKQSMFGKPAQMITGLLIGAVVLVALLIGLTTMAKTGAVPLFSPTPLVSPSGAITPGVLA